MVTIDFDERINFRIKKSYLKEASKIINKNSEKYENLSHFFRVALIKLIREEGGKIK